MENQEKFRIEDLFVIRPTNPEQNNWIITIGNELATNEFYETEEAAKNDIQNINWDLVASIAKTIAIGVYNQMNKKENEDGNN